MNSRRHLRIQVSQPLQSGGKKWLAAAKKPPPMSHVAINGVITVIEPVQKKENAFTIVARAMQIEATSATVDAQSQVVNKFQRQPEWLNFRRSWNHKLRNKLKQR